MSESDHFTPQPLSQREAERYFRVNEGLLEFARQFDYAEPNDRAVAVIGPAYLDNLLYEVLSAFLVEEDKESEKLLEPEGALGAFGSRIRACYCLGLIGDVVMSDLRCIGKIRNRFAHRVTASFADDDVVSWCKALRWHRVSLGEPHPGATARDLFQVDVNQLVGYLQGVVSIARHQKRTEVKLG
jgi:hypothetical protein